MAARASFSNDARIVKVPLPQSLLLKDYLLDDLSSCSSNGFRSYPRRQCFTTVRYLIEIDLNKHIKLPPTHKQVLKSKSKAKGKPKSKSLSVLHKASAVVVNVIKHFQFSGSGKHRKPNFLPRNLSRKLTKGGFWKKTSHNQNKEFKRLNSLDEQIKQKENIGPPSSKVSTAVTTTTTSNSNSNSSATSDSYSTATSDSYTTGSSLKINAAQKETEEKNIANGKATATATPTNDSAKKKTQSREKEQFSPVSVMDFDDADADADDEDEVTSPFQHTPLHGEGTKRKLMHKVQRSKILAQLDPVRLEDKIALSESKTHDSAFKSSLQDGLKFSQEDKHVKKKAKALLQLLKATMPCHNLFESTSTKSVLLGFFTEQINQGNVSNYAILQEAKDWMNGCEREMLESQTYKIAYIRDMEKGVKWSKYEDEEISSELEYQVFTTLVDEMILDFYS